MLQSAISSFATSRQIIA